MLNAYKKVIIVGIFFLMSVSFFGCARYVYVFPERYTPKFNIDVSQYKNKKVYFLGVTNKAGDTTREYFLSPDGKFKYFPPCTDCIRFRHKKKLFSGPNIETYFSKVFTKALLETGIVILDVDDPQKDDIILHFILKSITDENFTIDVELVQNKEVILFKTYTLNEPPLNDDLRWDEKNQEKRSYQMVNKFIEQVLIDKPFQVALLDEY